MKRAIVISLFVAAGCSESGVPIAVCPPLDRAVSCEVYLEDAGGNQTEIPECSPADDGAGAEIVPCHVVETGEAACRAFASQLSLNVRWGQDTSEGLPPPGTRVVSDCVVQGDPGANSSTPGR